MTRLLMTGALAWALACGSAFGQSLDTSAPAPNPSSQNSVKLVAVIAALPAGAPWLAVTISSFCWGTGRVSTWPGGRVPQALPPYSASFKAELDHAGYKVITPGEDNLFDANAGSADYEAAAVITDEHIQGCAGHNDDDTPTNVAKGDSTMKIDWQIYSPIKKQIVAHASTAGTAHLDKRTPGGLQQLVMAAFAENARELAQNADFRAAMGASKPLTAGFQMPGQQSKLVLSGSLKAGSRKVADAVGSVVTIMNEEGSGSGILVSDDGYVLTNAHVVGDDKNVRVRWSDGLEGLAQVIRVSKNRDVAIIKTDARDRTPLALKRGAVTPGQRVFAIGSPKGKDFQGTVSSGVISADRIVDGLRYIQSDVSVSPGSSGGALLDENGSVIGITVMLYLNGGQPAALNMFIPIGDAMDFLALEQH
jgi:serine protease Do